MFHILLLKSMKINKVLIAVFVLVAATMVACSEYEDTVEPSPVVAGDNPAVRFSAANPGAVEVDYEVLSFSLMVVRDNGSQALEVPIASVTDTAGVFNVPGTLSFPQGQDTTYLTVTINESVPTGTPLALTIEFDEAYTNPYKAEYPVIKSVVTVPPPCLLNKVRLELVFDGYASETTWALANEAGEVVGEGGPYADGDVSETVDFCIEDGTYTYTVNDTYGDGFSYPNNGSATLSIDGNQLGIIEGDFGTTASVTFTVPAE